MEFNGFIGEESINELYFSHQITDQQYVKHHSQEMLDAYNRYLQDHGLEDSEESAVKYLDEDDYYSTDRHKSQANRSQDG